MTVYQNSFKPYDSFEVVKVYTLYDKIKLTLNNHENVAS